MSGTIPQSPALVEVQVESLGELFSRDPEGYSQGDLDRIILALREQRARYEGAGTGAGAKPKAKAKGKNLEQLLAGPVGTASPEDLGF